MFEDRSHLSWVSRICGAGEQGVDGFGQGGEVEVGGGAGGFGSGLAVLGVAFDEDCLHAEVAAELNVGERVAEDDAGLGGDVGEVGQGLVEEAGEGLAAVALGFIVGAEVEGVDVGLVARRAVLVRLAWISLTSAEV